MKENITEEITKSLRVNGYYIRTTVQSLTLPDVNKCDNTLQEGVLYAHHFTTTR